MARRETGRAAPLAGGEAGIGQGIADPFAAPPAGASGAAWYTPAADPGSPPTRPAYAGRSIGRGPVGGSIQRRVNRRRTSTGAWWRANHVRPWAALAALIDTPDWQAFGSAA